MQTTIELSSSLYQAIESCAARRGQQFDETVQELLLTGLRENVSAVGEPQSARIKKHSLSGLPCLDGGQPALPGMELTPERVANLLLQQEVAWQHEAGR